MRVLDLFCGAGGLSLGFELAGARIVGGLDLDPVPLRSFHLNHPNANVFQGDIRNISSHQLESVGPIDILIGGPSCQGFSTHGKRLADDPRNFLFREFIRVARDLLPNWVVIENVKGLLTYDKGAFRRQIHDALNELGYEVRSEVLLAADYGVPQRRERIVFIANRIGAPILFPYPTHGPGTNKEYVTVRDAIGDLPPIEPGDEYEGPYRRQARSEFQAWAREGSSAITLHCGKILSPYAHSIVSNILPGAGVRSLPLDLLPDRFKKMRTISDGSLRRDCTTLYHRLAWERPAYTITCYFTNVSSGPFVHPDRNRALTLREAARLQSFPDAFFFVNSSIAKQIGNAVPPLFGRAIAQSILQSSGRSSQKSLSKKQIIQLTMEQGFASVS